MVRPLQSQMSVLCMTFRTACLCFLTLPKKERERTETAYQTESPFAKPYTPFSRPQTPRALEQDCFTQVSSFGVLPVTLVWAVGGGSIERDGVQSARSNTVAVLDASVHVHVL